jgi:hypothetical protein
MSKSQLALVYNEMAFELGLKEVSTFRTREDGIRRVRELAERRGPANGEETVSVGLVGLEDEEEENEVTIQDEIRAGETDPVMELPEDPAEARDQLHREFGDEDLPAPGEVPAEKVEKARKSSGQRVSERSGAGRGSKAYWEERKIPGVTLDDPNDPEAVYAALGAKDGTNKARLARLLCDNHGKDVSIEEMVVATYGDADGIVEAKKGALLGGVLVGIELAIERRSLPVRVVRSRGGSARIEPISAE